MTWSLLPATSPSPGGDRWALELPRANLRESSGSPEEKRLCPIWGEGKFPRAHDIWMALKEGGKQRCSRRRDQNRQRPGDGPVVTVW